MVGSAWDQSQALVSLPVAAGINSYLVANMTELKLQ